MNASVEISIQILRAKERGLAVEDRGGRPILDSGIKQKYDRLLE